MKNAKRIWKILLATLAIATIAIVLAGLFGSEQATAPTAEQPAETGEDASPEADNPASESAEPDPGASSESSAGASEPTKESTPAERSERTATPSDAVSYSEDDLPPELR